MQVQAIVFYAASVLSVLVVAYSLLNNLLSQILLLSTRKQRYIKKIKQKCYATKQQ